MIPKLSIAMHSGVFDHWPLLQNLLKSFLVCNEYPSIEIMLVESGGNKKIRDWFEKIDFDDFFINLDGQKTTIRKHPKVSIEKTIKFIDFDSSTTGRNSCYSRAISQCIDSFKGDFFVMLAEDNQFIAKGDLISDYIKILDNFGKDESMIYFFTQQRYKLEKQNNRATGPHKIKTTNLSFFTPVQQKWDMGAICSRGLYGHIKQTKQTRNIIEEKSWDVCHGFVLQNSLLFTLSDLRRIYPAIPCGIWMHNDDQDAAKAKIIERTNLDPNFLLYKTRKKADLYESLKVDGDWKKPLSTEDYSVEN